MKTCQGLLSVPAELHGYLSNQVSCDVPSDLISSLSVTILKTFCCRRNRCDIDVHCLSWIVTFAKYVASTICEFRSRQQKFLTLIFFSLDANGTLQKMAVFLCTHFINQKIINPGTLQVRAYCQLIKWSFSIPCRTGQLCISRAPILTCPQALCML